MSSSIVGLIEEVLTQLKIGELATKIGLSIRSLHHRDTIGLLSLSKRTAAGARLQGCDDWIRLQRTEALKQLACSLPDINATLDSAGSAPTDTVRRQIAALSAQALQAQRLSQHLQHLLDMTAAGAEVAAAD